MRDTYMLFYSKDKKAVERIAKDFNECVKKARKIDFDGQKSVKGFSGKRESCTEEVFKDLYFPKIDYCCIRKENSLEPDFVGNGVESYEGGFYGYMLGFREGGYLNVGLFEAIREKYYPDVDMAFKMTDLSKSFFLRWDPDNLITEGKFCWYKEEAELKEFDTVEQLKDLMGEDMYRRVVAEEHFSEKEGCSNPEDLVSAINSISRRKAAYKREGKDTDKEVFSDVEGLSVGKWVDWNPRRFFFVWNSDSIYGADFVDEVDLNAYPKIDIESLLYKGKDDGRAK